jgi:hypothetical protein
MKVRDYNFHRLVRVMDLDPDKGLNDKLLAVARSRPELSDSAGPNMALIAEWWADRLVDKFMTCLRAYLKAMNTDKSPQVGLHVFFSHTIDDSFVGCHDHVGDGDLVGIYYARVPAEATYAELPFGDGLYDPPPSSLVVYDPGAAGCYFLPDYQVICPLENRLIIHPSVCPHLVTPGVGERLAVTCNFKAMLEDESLIKSL